jgi:hypothetical protein
VARRIGRVFPSAVTLIVRRTASAFISWSNEIKIIASRRVICPFGIFVSIFGGGVVNVQTTSLA